MITTYSEGHVINYSIDCRVLNGECSPLVLALVLASLTALLSQTMKFYVLRLKHGVAAVT